MKITKSINPWDKASQSMAADLAGLPSLAPTPAKRKKKDPEQKASSKKAKIKYL